MVHSLVDQACVASSYRSSIVSSRRAITEERLAQQYRVGRAPVRAALKGLTHEKLVDIGVRQRYSVTPLTLRHDNELFAVRALLKAACGALAARRIDAEHLRCLDELCQAR
jgi:DNA-binding GntR family transcriptional regulator